MRVRLRDPRRPVDEAAYYSRIYPQGYRHDKWPDHVERVVASVGMIRKYVNGYSSVADLSCGDGAILRALSQAGMVNRLILGDLNRVPDPALALWRQGSRYLDVSALLPGPLPDTLEQMPEPVDLFVLSETLEHMADPDALLRRLTQVSTYLFMSTPVEEPREYGNLEHYWSWGTADIAEMLNDSGWTPLERQILDPVSTRGADGRYVFQLWMAVVR